MPTKFGRKSPWPKWSATLGSKVRQRSAGVIQGSYCSGMPYGYQILEGRTPTKVKCNAGSQRSCRVKRGQPGVILLSDALWLPNLVWRTPGQSVVQCWCRRSYEVKWWSTGDQIAKKFHWADDAIGALVYTTKISKSVCKYVGVYVGRPMYVSW